jgi:hypothetical protein
MAMTREERLAKRREYYKANRETIIADSLAKNRERRDADPEAEAKRRHEYYLRHRDAAIERSRKYREEHREELKVSALVYREAHRDEINARGKAWREANPERVKAREENRKIERMIDPEPRRLRDRAYRQANRERLKAAILRAGHKSSRSRVPRSWFLYARRSRPDFSGSG